MSGGPAPQSGTQVGIDEHADSTTVMPEKLHIWRVQERLRQSASVVQS